MSLDLFAGIPVRDYSASMPWYESLLGEPPTFLAHATEAVWELAEHRFIYVVEDPGRAGNALVTLFTDDLDEVVDAIGNRGIEPTGRESYPNGVGKVTYRDPDGNEVGFAGAPSDGGPAS